MLDEPIQLPCGPAHPPAEAPSVAPAELAGHRIRLPGVVPGTEWGAYYAEFAALRRHLAKNEPAAGAWRPGWAAQPSQTVPSTG